MKLLIIEDDKILSENLKQSLRKEGFAVDTAKNIEYGLNNIEINDYDCIILDINLPDGSGFDLLKNIRNQEIDTPIIIVTARGQTEDKIKGLNLGADDYVPKPVDVNELIARIRAIIRRNSNKSLPIVCIGDLVIKPAEHKSMVCENRLTLTSKEFAVLEYLAQHTNQIITRTMLMEHIWGSDFDVFSNVIDVYIKNIRREIKKYSDQTLIQTIRGKGYILGTND